MMDEAKRERDHIAPPDTKQWARQMERVRVFDQLIYNIDRNTGQHRHNQGLEAVDDRPFTILPPVSNASEAREIYTCERTMFERMQALNEETLNRELKPFLTVRK
jgi:hypothetical protein